MTTTNPSVKRTTSQRMSTTGGSPQTGQQGVAPSSISHGSGKYDYLMKLIMIGDSGVGKSCLLIRFSEDTFTHSFISTVGIDFKIRTMQVGDKTIKLQIYDTAGQDRFRTITAAYYRGSHGILLVYDVTDERSFINIRSWVTGMPQHTQSAVKMIIGNKCDLDEKRVISFERGQQLAKEFDFQFIETSAKANTNVELAFYKIVEEIKTKMEQDKFALEKNEGNVELAAEKQGGKCSC